MSSFVIGKDSYIRAAGVVAALAENKKLWVYDYSVGHNMEKADYYRRFSECYTMNALSVMEQYNDDEMETAPETDKECSAIFETAYRKTKSGLIGFSASFDLKQVISNLLHFFQSAMYQTEKEAYYFKMQMFFNQLTAALTEKYLLPDSECWGEFTF